MIMAGDAGAQQNWERQKGNCEEVFGSFQQAQINELKYCAALWEAYRDVSRLDDSRKQAVAGAFQRLLREGDPEGRFVARNALTRLGFPPAADTPSAGADTSSRAPERKKYRALPASDGDRKAAGQVRAKGMARYKKKDFQGALVMFQEALSRDPGSEQILYDIACCHGLLGDGAQAAEYLTRLSDLGTKPALARLRKAWTDRDFDRVRDDPGFKRATGYARIKVLNGMPTDDKELGDDNNYKLVALLKSPKLGFVAELGGDDKHSRDRPHIWFKDFSKASAFVVRQLIGHPRTRLVPIDWDTEWDLIVSWADKVEVVDGVATVRYSMTRKDATGKTPEERLDGAARSRDEALSSPDEYIGKAEKTIAEPGKAADKVGSTVDRATGAVEKVGDAVDKVKGLGGKF
jgi:tetratricopeptide (TPR) repeat protein